MAYVIYNKLLRPMRAQGLQEEKRHQTLRLLKTITDAEKTISAASAAVRWAEAERAVNY